MLLGCIQYEYRWSIHKHCLIQLANMETIVERKQDPNQNCTNYNILPQISNGTFYAGCIRLFAVSECMHQSHERCTRWSNESYWEGLVYKLGYVHVGHYIYDLRLPLVEEVNHYDGFQGQSLNKQAAFV